MRLKLTSSCRPMGWSLMVGLALSTVAVACQVPVFRYAIERWNPDRYRVLVLSAGPLAEPLVQSLSVLRGSDERAAPVELSLVDIQRTEDPLIRQLWDQHATEDGAPLLVALYPKRSAFKEQVAHVCRLTDASPRQLLNSPARQEIVKRLTAGHSAVWVLVQSGDADKDALALQVLQDQLAIDAKRMELPSAEEMEISEAALAESKIPLRIEFSVISVSRDDPREKFLVDCLLGSEADLADYAQEPIAFPVFGRGIVLYALVGKGISPEVIRSASAFIVGPCSCQVKEQNPGFDLLLDCDWDRALGSSLISSPVPSIDVAPRLLTIPPGKQKP